MVFVRQWPNLYLRNIANKVIRRQSQSSKQESELHLFYSTKYIIKSKLIRKRQLIQLCDKNYPQLREIISGKYFWGALWVLSLAHILPKIMEEAGLMVYAAASHQEAIEMLRLLWSLPVFSTFYQTLSLQLWRFLTMSVQYFSHQ